MLVFVQCENEPKEIEETEIITQNSDSPVSFECEENLDSSGIKTLFFLFGDNKVALNSIPICKPISKKKWGSLGIPKNAISVVGGKWSSGSAYHYVILDSTQVTVYQVSSDELDGEVSAPEEIYKTKL